MLGLEVGQVVVAASGRAEAESQGSLVVWPSFLIGEATSHGEAEHIASELDAATREDWRRWLPRSGHPVAHVLDGTMDRPDSVQAVWDARMVNPSGGTV
ncbi:hypothetical protein SRHO_G00300760 [Serrasalmus rhombeus]